MRYKTCRRFLGAFHSTMRYFANATIFSVSYPLIVLASFPISSTFALEKNLHCPYNDQMLVSFVGAGQYSASLMTCQLLLAWVPLMENLNEPRWKILD